MEKLKKDEYASYLTGAIEYDKLKYTKDVVEYLKPVEKMKV